MLIVSASEKGSDRLAEWLGAGYAVTACRTEADARPLLASGAFPLLIISAPLADGDGESLCLKKGVGALLLVPQAAYPAARERLEPAGVMVLAKPLHAALFQAAASLLRASQARILELEEKLSDVRTIERAKGMLMHILQMSEDQAHRYIERQAMDLRVKRRIIAENILKTYEN